MEQHKLNPTQRFSDRVDNYVKYRPTYPTELFTFLAETLGLKTEQTVVDVGSGTGIFSGLLLKGGYHVVGVEPNPEMRKASEELLGGYEKFRNVDGRSDATGLPDASADFITAAQAFHWFEPIGTRREFMRILRPGGLVVLIWNDRRSTETPFAAEYEALINSFSTDYRKVNHKNIVDDDIRGFLGVQGFGKKSFFNFQDLDFDGLVGRLTSSSYAPNVDHPKYPEMVTALRDLFEKYQASEMVKIEYDAKIYYGQLMP